MNELDYQSLVIKAVRGGGGFAFKMANRFLVGIPDLFVQVPGFSTSIWEVKLARCQAFGDTIDLKLTAKQRFMLRDYAKAGGVCGVISFLKSPKQEWIAVSRVQTVTMPPSKYNELPRGKREITILQQLVQELENEPIRVG